MEKVKNIFLMEDQNMKVNIQIIKNGMEKDMMNLVILFMNYIMVMEMLENMKMVN